MSSDIRESDWKTLRKLAPIAMARAFDRSIDRIQTTISMNRKSQIKFWDIKNYADDQRLIISRTFDGLTRSNSIERLAMIWAQDLLTDEEIEQFTPETRQKASQLRGER